MDLGDLSDLAEGELRCFPDVGPDGVVVCRVDGELHALVDRCSHADSRLSDGRLRGGWITCALHGARFDVRTGAHGGPPAVTGVDVYALDATNEAAVVIRLP